MAKNLTHRLWPVKWRPLLDIWVDIGFLRMQTSIWRDHWSADATDYLFLEIRLLEKWGFRIRLYDTEIRSAERG